MARKESKSSVRERLAGSSLAHSWRSSRTNYHLFLQMMGLDLSVLLSLVLLNYGLQMLFPTPQAIIGGAAKTLALIGVALFVYVFLVIIIYSFFQFVSLGRVKRIFNRPHSGFARFGRFLVLNIIIVGAYIFIFVLITFLFLTTVRIDALAAVRDVVFVVFAVFAYITLSIANVSFMNGKDVMPSIKAAFEHGFGSPRKYLGFAAFIVVAAGVAGLALYAVDSLVLGMLGDAIQAKGVFVGYAVFNTFFTGAVILAFISFMRVYIYAIVSRASGLVKR